MSSETLLTSLETVIRARLSFRASPFAIALGRIDADASAKGAYNGNRRLVVRLTAFEEECLARADLLISQMRAARPSWSPNDVIGAESALRERMHDLLKADLTAAVDLAVPQRQDAAGEIRGQSASAISSALAMLDGAITEIISAARTEMVAKSTVDRPTYAAGGNMIVAAPGATVRDVHQTSGANAAELARLLGELAEAIRPHSTEPLLQAAATEIEDAGSEIRSGKPPRMEAIRRWMGIIRESAELAERIPRLAELVTRVGQAMGMV